MGIAVGFGIGYVLGTRAGREQYARICACAGKLRRFPLVARPLDAAGEKMSALVRTQGEKVTDKVADAVKERLFRMPAAEPGDYRRRSTDLRGLRHGRIHND